MNVLRPVFAYGRPQHPYMLNDERSIESIWGSESVHQEVGAAEASWKTVLERFRNNSDWNLIVRTVDLEPMYTKGWRLRVSLKSTVRVAYPPMWRTFQCPYEEWDLFQDHSRQALSMAEHSAHGTPPTPRYMCCHCFQVTEGQPTPRTIVPNGSHQGIQHHLCSTALQRSW